ncbi:cytidine deoxycytidylate deaminase [Colletotrichum karsti]|uniref:Cytidine deoxycytidylate deaminase n=1 Tax=Colletotrichum karsti TaxID=1095194 RepID=A0A9P6HUF8_9PEZI|nr:cytidine deoxycytidylate deaminase [Colletotrichum karsti]KAF9871257.1 cytidine deoxycytidylate deaminase [Colletotrichum karsti]
MEARFASRGGVWLCGADESCYPPPEMLPQVVRALPRKAGPHAVPYLNLIRLPKKPTLIKDPPPTKTQTMTPATPDPKILRRCVELAREALDAGDDPFGSVLVGADGAVIREDRNRTKTGDGTAGRPDATLHPEFTLARWAQLNLTDEERAGASVYTSGEHCPMCAAAHAWVGLGAIVYVSSTEQYASWLEEFGVRPGRKVAPLPIRQVAPNVPVRGPIAGLAEEVKELHRKRHAAGV